MNLLAPFVPETVHDAVEIMFDGQTDRLTYDEVRAKAPYEMQAYEEWLGKIRESKEASAPFLKLKSGGQPRSLVRSPDGLRQSLSGRGGARMHDIQGFPTRNEEHEDENNHHCGAVVCRAAHICAADVAHWRTITFSFSPVR